MSELWKESTMEITYVNLIGLIERSDFYKVGFIAFVGDKKTYVDVSFTKEGKRYFNLTTLKNIMSTEAMQIAREADTLTLCEHQSIFDEAYDRNFILEKCLEMEHVEIRIDNDFYQKLDDGLWMVNADQDNVVPSTTVYHDLFDFTKTVRVVK